MDVLGRQTGEVGSFVYNPRYKVADSMQKIQLGDMDG